MVVGFFAISLYSGGVAYADLQTQNATDAGIITQAVAATAHGNPVPFYESYDCLVKARCSFLLVHPSFVLYAAVPFYVLAPSTVTLFALRAAAVAAAAIPLYWLTRRVTGSPGKGLLAAGMFLIWAPDLVGDAFSLHLESLLPLELFTLAALWHAGRYRLGLTVALVTFLTFEVFPLFTFLVGAFFLFPFFERPVRARWRRWRGGGDDRRSLRSSLALGFHGFREISRLREVRYTLVLMAASVAAYVALSYFINVGGSELLGVASAPASPGVGGVFSNPSSPPFHSLGTILQSAQTVSTAEYWLILYALVAFIPLLSPRALILSLPWVGWTFLTDSSRFSTVGHEYAFIAAGPMFIGLAYGLQRVPLGRLHPRTNTAEARPGPSAGTAVPLPPFARRPHTASGIAWTGVLAVIVVANALLLPINPALPDLGVNPGTPFEADYFAHSLEISPSFAGVEDLVSTIPNGATVAAPAGIFPLLANDPHAYVLVEPKVSNASNLPFNQTGGPEFVFVQPAFLGVMSSSLSRTVANPLVYGLRGYVGSTPKGPILLYERGYSSPAELFGPAVSPLAATFFPEDGLQPGARGVVASNSSAPSGQVIQSVAGSSRFGLVWTGPDAFLSPGTYTIDVRASTTGPNVTMNPNAAVLRLLVVGFGGTPVNTTLRASAFVPGQWTVLEFNFTLLDPLANVNVQGSLQSNQVAVAVASVAIAPTPA